MIKSYVIHWRSTVNGRAGRGTKLFEQEAAQRLAQELNREFPEIRHEAVEASTEPEPSPPSSALNSGPAENESESEHPATGRGRLVHQT